MPLSIKVNLRVTGHCNQGGRKYMEDMFSVAYQQTSDDKDLEYAFFGIFDGHGGGEAATFAKEHLMDIIVKQRNFWSDKDEDVLRAIRDGYVNTHYAMWRELEKWPRTASGLPSTAGTTASVAFIRKGKIYIGHVGDSGIILGYQDDDDPQWKAKPLTKDHKPESVPEMIRIQESGGKVVSKSGVPRVVWNRPRIGHKGPVRRSTHIDEIPFLAVARSLGDLWSYNSELDTFVVSPEPDVKVVTVDVKSHRCLIFGTDGLWNVLTPQAAVAIVQSAERHNEKHLIASQQTGGGQTDIQMWINPSKSLVDRALDRWSSARLRADNTSVVTLMLDPPGPSRSEVLMSRKNEQVPSPRSYAIAPAVCSPPEPMEALPTAMSTPSTTILPKTDEISTPKNPENSQPPRESSPPTIDAKSAAATRNETVKSIEEDVDRSNDISVASTSRESIQVAEISSSDASVDPPQSTFVDEDPKSTTNPEIPNPKIQNLEKNSETPNANVVSSESSSESSSTSESTSPPPTTSPSERPSSPNHPTSKNSITDENSSRLIRQNCFYGNCGEFKNRPRLRRTCGPVYVAGTPSATPKNTIANDSTINSSSTINLHRALSQTVALPSHLDVRQMKRRRSVNTTTTTTTTTTSSCLGERQKSYFVGGTTRTKRGIAFIGLTRENRTTETSKNNRTSTTTTTTGSKRRHSSTSEPADDATSCATQEPMAKRRTRSEDRPLLPTDENVPSNREKQQQQQQQQQQHSRLRWPEETSSSRLRSDDNSRSSCNPTTTTTMMTTTTTTTTTAVNLSTSTEKLSSPNAYQRRSLEKKATPVKTIRRPSINGSNRVQLRGSFALRDWDQTKSVHRERSRLNRTVGGTVVDSASPAPNLQRWLRSDTLAATPVKTLRSRNVDITGHTVPAQLAHQYGVVKQNRLSLPAKIKIAGKLGKLGSTISTSSSTTTTTPVASNKLQKTNAGVVGTASGNSGVGTSGSGITRRVKSPYNPSARSALGTRSRLKRLGK